MSVKFRKKIRLKHKLWIFISILLVLIISVLLYFNYCVNPVIISTSEAKIKSLTSRAVNSAVQTVVNDSNVYDEMIEITTNEAGEITLIQAKSAGINKFAKQISQTANQNLDLISSEGMKIPLGTLTGIPVFVGLGPEINFNVLSISTIQSSFKSEFTSAGINQTNHRIYLNLSTNVSVIMPTASRTIVTTSQILVCEAILIGKIPDTYLNSSSLDEMLNLIPG